MNPENDYSLSVSNQNSGPDIKKYIFKGLAYWYLFIIFIPAAYAVAVIANRYIIPEYGLHTTILLKTGSSEEEIAGGLRFFSRSRNLDTEIGLLKSYKLNKQAIDSLNLEVSYFKNNRWKSDRELYKNSPFIAHFDSARKHQNNTRINITILSQNQYRLQIENPDIEKDMSFGETFANDKYKFKLEKSPNYFSENVIGEEYSFSKKSTNQLVNAYKNRLQVEISPEQSSILWLWTQGRTPAKDADYLNMLSKIFIARGLEEKNAKAESVIQFIDRQLSGVQDSLQKHQNRLQFEKEKSKTLDISSEAEMLLTRQHQLEERMRELANHKEYYRYMLNEATNGNFESLVAPQVVGMDDKILTGYMEDISKILTQRELLNFDLKSDIPSSKLLNYKIEQIQNKIRLHIEQIQNINKQKIEDTKKELADVSRQILRLPASERNIINAQRIFNINDATYTLLLTRRTEAAITQASNKADSEVLDMARPENAVNRTTPKSSNTRKALMIGALIPIMIIVLLEFLNNKIEERNDIENHTKIPILSTIINNPQKSENPVLAHDNSPVSESFRTLRTNLMFVLKGKSPSIITVSSTVSGEGKTFVSQNLAAVMAISGKKTLLVGLDMRKPKLQRTFDYYKNKGISTYLSRKHSFDEIIKNTSHPYLDIILSGPVPPNPAELIESEEMNNFLNEAKTKYDYIIIDTPPVAVVTDALLLTKASDSFLYVMRQNYSSKNVLRIIDEVKNKTEVSNLLIILNDASITGGYGYRYNYGYGRGYYAEDLEKKNGIKSFFKKLKRKT